jgi:DNA-binding NarL/FixJ family response regulator
MSIRILIADDHGVVRRGLRVLLESVKGWEVCAEATNGREAVEGVAQHRPDVAILDISMPKLNGVEAARQIRKTFPTTEILLLTMHDSDVLLREGLEAGANGFLLKDDADQYLLAAVEALRGHKQYFSPKIADALAAGRKQPVKAGADVDVPLNRLTPREREIVQLLAEGKVNKEVGAILNISARTVETHRAKIMLKLGLHSITELVHYAIRNRIIHS